MKLGPRNINIGSIQGRLNAIGALFVIATAVVMGIAGFRMTLDFERQRFHDHFGLLASYFASNAELGVLLGNEKNLALLAENMLRIRDVQAVEVVDGEGRRIIRREGEDPGAPLATVSATVVARSMQEEAFPFAEGDASAKVIGRVDIAYSLAGLAQLRNRLALRFVLIAIVLSLLSAVMYWLFSRTINAPLGRLMDVAAQVSGGQTDVRAPVGSLREVDTLSRAINDMLDALERHRRDLNEANAAIAKQQVLAEVGKFSMIVAHEIKNPLAVIKGSISVLRKEKPIEAALKKRLIGYLDEEIERINKLIEDFLLFARPRPPAFQAMPVGELVRSLAQRIELMDSGVAIDLAPTAIEAAGEIRCDQALLERALLNVVRNALEASAGQVRVEAAIEHGWLTLRVLDRGPGIDPGICQSIFEPFFSTKSKGTGLGLVIARDVVNAHAGTLEVSNREGGGAAFVLTIPVGEAGLGEAPVCRYEPGDSTISMQQRG